MKYKIYRTELKTDEDTELGKEEKSVKLNTPIDTEDIESLRKELRLKFGCDRVIFTYSEIEEICPKG